MRIISQNGNVDLSYEKFVLGITKDNKIACCRECVAPPYEIYNGIIAEYSSKEKALKAMEMLREAYVGKPILNIDELPNLTPQDFREKLGTGDILLCNKSSVDVSFSSNYCFQFPKDDEVEV